MAKYKLLIKPSGVKEIEAIANIKDRRRVVERINKLSQNPRSAGCEKLSGQDKYRVRQGHFRIVYSIEDTSLTVNIVKVGHRKDV